MGRVSRLATGLLVIIFCMSSLVKLTDKVDPKAHALMKKEFQKFAKVSPVTQLFKIKVSPHQFMKFFAYVEGVIGLFILTGPRELSIVACIAGIILQGTVLQMMFMLKNPLFTMIPASVAIALLIIKMIYLITTVEEEPLRPKTE